MNANSMKLPIRRIRIHGIRQECSLKQEKKIRDWINSFSGLKIQKKHGSFVFKLYLISVC